MYCQRPYCSVKKPSVSSCDLCDSAGGQPLWQDELCRVVLVEDRDYPGFCRVILNRHVSEMTDLDAATRQRLMRVVFAAEQALRELMRPAKINLASFGNVVAHLHWHIIARFTEDKHFPGSIWGEARRAGAPKPLDREALRRALQQLLQPLGA
jgi:diadenosine tetraphosphate (Ap4A) HIT family hydrolase